MYGPLYQIWARWIPKSTFFVHNLYLRLITSLTNTSLLSDGQKVCTTLPFFNAHDVKRSLNLIHTENAVPLSFCVIGIFWSCDVFTCYNEHFLKIKYDAPHKRKRYHITPLPLSQIIRPPPHGGFCGEFRLWYVMAKCNCGIYACSHKNLHRLTLAYWVFTVVYCYNKVPRYRKNVRYREDPVITNYLVNGKNICYSGVI